MTFSLSFICRVSLFFALLTAAFYFASTTHAQGSAGVGLMPATIEEGAKPGDEKRYTVVVSNLSGTDQKYYISARDITGVRDGGVPEYAKEGTERTGYELSEWVALDATEIDIPAGEEKPVSFTLSVPDTATPGSHFGAVFVSVEPPRLRSTGAAVGYEVANIISIRVAGDAVESAQIRQFSTDRYMYSSADINFDLRIENEGNVLVRPIGPLEITNMFGKKTAVLTFNETLAGVFPGTTRQFNFNWKSEGTGFGRYEARVSPIYGDEGKKSTISSTVTFWVLPMNIIGPALGILAVLLLLIYGGVRLYVRRTMAMMSAGGERRIVRSSNRRRGNPLFLLTFLAMVTTTVLFMIILLVLFA